MPEAEFTILNNEVAERTAAPGQRVPAVDRAARVLAHLAESSEPLTLTALSRALRIAPSSLLAILATLRAAGLVVRDEPTGRYGPGAGLVALGAAAAQRLGVLQLFQTVADRLAEQAGESALLWLRQDEAFVLAAGREAPSALRYVPPLGLVASGHGLARRAADGDPIVEHELQPGVWMLAAALPVRRASETALLGVAGPADRLAGAAGQPARRALLAAVEAVAALQGLTPGPTDTSEQPGRIEPEQLDCFLRQGLVATLAYLADDGYPATVPLWYAWDGRAFWLAPRPGAEWAEHVRRGPRVSLAVSESRPPLRRVLARGHVEAVEPSADDWRAVEAQLAARYGAGLPAGRRPGQRQLLRLVPERLIAWRGLLPYPGVSLTPGEAGSRDSA